jgi:hypothetical protein
MNNQTTCCVLSLSLTIYIPLDNAARKKQFNTPLAVNKKKTNEKVCLINKGATLPHLTL